MHGRRRGSVTEKPVASQFGASRTDQKPNNKPIGGSPTRKELSFLNLTIASLLAFTLTSSLAATITWTGGGDGTSWSDSHNWDSNAVPGTADDAVISGASGTVNVNSTVTIRSLQCQRAFNIVSGAFAVTAGASRVQGALTASAGTSVTAAGASTSFICTNVANIDGISLYANGGAVLALPGVTSYVRGGCTHGYWQASGIGSRIVLAGLTSVVSPPNCGAYYVNVTAQSGGRVELAAVQSLGVGYYGVLADGSGSVVDLSGLTSENTTNSYVTVEARNQGQVLLPQLVDGATVDLAIRSGGVISVAQWQRLHSITLDGVATNFPALTNIGSSITLNGVAASFPVLTNIDGISLYANGGAVLALPGATSYVRGACTHGYWQASGIGSRIVLAGLTSVVSPPNCGAYYVNVTAQSGGRVELPAAQAISGGYVAILADGIGSVVDLHSLSGFLMSGQGSLTAQNGGVILLNNQAWLLANVSINIPPGNPVLPPTLIAAPTLTLYGQAWHSYWVEKLDTSNPASGWQFVARVPLTNAFQAFAAAPPLNTAYRVWEFVADPPILDGFRAPGQQYSLILYGATNKSYQLQSTSDLTPPSTWTAGTVVSMTNAFRFLPPAPIGPSGPRQFFRAKEQ